MAHPGNVLTGYTGTIHFSTSDAGAGSTLPPDYTFLPSDGGVHVFTGGVTLVTPGSQIVTATDTLNAAITGSAMVSVRPGVAASLTLAAPATGTEGSGFAITVTARDGLGNIATGYNGTVSFTTSDPAQQPPLVLPSPYTFIPADQGVHVFGVTLVTVGTGSQTITATDSNGLTGTATVRLASPWPFVQSIDRTTPSGPETDATSVVYTVTFSEPVIGVDAADFQVAVTGALAATVTQVTPVSGSVYTVTVTVNAVTGTATLGLNLVDKATIHDLNGNLLTQATPGASFSSQTTFAAGNGFKTISGARGVEVADVNGDGKADLVVVNTLYDNVGLLLGNGDGTFQNMINIPTLGDPSSVAVADLTGDGKPDIIVAEEYSDCVGVLLGNGNGTFQGERIFGTGDKPVFVAVADVNGDGIPDLIVANQSSNDVSVLLGNGNGTFQSQTTFAAGAGPDSLAVADVSGDGKADIIVANYFQQHRERPFGQRQRHISNPDYVHRWQHRRVQWRLRTSTVTAYPDLVFTNEYHNTVSVLAWQQQRHFPKPGDLCRRLRAEFRCRGRRQRRRQT